MLLPALVSKQLAGWLAGQSAGGLVGLPVGWLVSSLVGWLDSFSHIIIYKLAEELVPE